MGFELSRAVVPEVVRVIVQSGHITLEAEKPAGAAYTVWVDVRSGVETTMMKISRAALTAARFAFQLLTAPF